MSGGHSSCSWQEDREQLLVDDPATAAAEPRLPALLAVGEHDVEAMQGDRDLRPTRIPGAVRRDHPLAPLTCPTWNGRPSSTSWCSASWPSTPPDFDATSDATASVTRT